MKFSRMIALGASFAIMTAFASGAAQASDKVKYQCKNGTKLTVIYKSNKATVSLPGADNITLPQGPSGDGFLYAKKGYALRGVGNKVTWTTAKGKMLECRAR